MTQEDFIFIIYESFDHLPALQSYFKKKRKDFKCIRSEYAFGLTMAFKTIDAAVNQRDYNHVMFTKPDGETIEYELEAGHHAEQIFHLQTTENLKGAKTSFPNKIVLDLRQITNGRFNGILTPAHMEHLWPQLEAYLQTIEQVVEPVHETSQPKPPQQPKENTEPNRLQMAKGAVITNKWANGLIAEMKYNSTEIWHQVAGYHYEGDTVYKNHSDHILDTVNFPIVTKGFTAFLIQLLGNSEQIIFDKYYELCLNNFKRIESRKPGSSMRNLDAEFYPVHISQEKEFAKFSEQIHPYLSKDEIELINQYIEAYFKYIEQVYSPKGSTEEGTLEKQEAGNELSVPDWCIIFYYIDEAGTQEGNKIDRMEKFIEDNNVVSPSGVHTTKSNFKKEYHEIENRINSKNNKKPLPPKRIENILHYLKNNKKALQAAESDIEHLTNEIEEYKRNTY